MDITFKWLAIFNSICCCCGSLLYFEYFSIENENLMDVGYVMWNRSFSFIYCCCCVLSSKSNHKNLIYHRQKKTHSYSHPTNISYDIEALLFFLHSIFMWFFLCSSWLIHITTVDIWTQCFSFWCSYR